MSSLRATRLSAGQAAPEFSARDVNGKNIILNKTNSRYILLVFFRYSGCPWCNLAIHRLSLEYDTLKQNGCEVIAFIQSQKKDIVENIYERHEVKPKFSIIADHERKFYKLYAVNESIKAAAMSITKIPTWLQAVKKHGFRQKSIDGNLLIVPASFLIDGRTKKIIKTSYGSSFYDTNTFVEIYKSVFFKEL